MQRIATFRRRAGRKPLQTCALIVCLAIGVSAHSSAQETRAPASAAAASKPGLIPWPSSVSLSDAERFPITKNTAIEVSPDPELQRVARALADLLRPALDTTLTIRESSGSPAPGAIRLELTPSSDDGTDESYELTIATSGIRISGATPAGVFYGVQTLRQLLPYSVELRGARPHELSVPTGKIVDRPRFEWRGAMLDVARHFFEPADVKRYMDLLALYKLNRLHLHLSDDQGWRIEIAGWPNLTKHGGSTEVGGGAGGFYTKQDYADLVAYARDRFITIVPEIDMPSHINAALASYPDLNCDGKAPSLYTGIRVGFSALCVDKDITYKFIDDVVREIAAMTPGLYFHIGGDEVEKLNAKQYGQFMERAQDIVQKHGKAAIGWDEIAHAKVLPTTLIQYWRPDASIDPPAGTKLILSPANKVYLDMKYNDETVLGLKWAGLVDVSVPYEWDPATRLPNVPESAILGVEAPLWSETVATMADVEFMAFPRLPAVAEVAWSPQAARRWDDFRDRLGAQAPRWSALGINAYWSPNVDWQR
ncbi:MAG: beta-N-acetylhexosaminidase [Vicinamibacteraceae bacterium]